MESAAILQDRHEQLLRGEWGHEVIPPPIDVLGSARRYVANPTSAGREQIRDDWRLALGEALSKLTHDLPPPRILDYDPEYNRLLDHGYDMAPIFTSGLSPVLPAEAQQRRIAERVEYATHLRAVEMGMTDQSIITFSIIAGTEEVRQTQVPEIEKMMIRLARPIEIEGQKKLLLQTAGIDGRLLTPQVMGRLFEELGIGSVSTDRTSILGTQIALPASEFSDITDVIQLLDDYLGDAIYMGRPVASDHPRDYLAEYDLMQARYEEIDQISAELEDWAIVQAQNDTDPYLAEWLARKKMKAVALRLCQADPRRAQDIFDEATADQLRSALVLEQAGDTAGAAKYRSAAADSAPEVAFCEAGSCGLRSLNSSESALVKSFSLDPSQSLFFEEGRSPCCGKGYIIAGKTYVCPTHGPSKRRKQTGTQATRTPKQSLFNMKKSAKHGSRKKAPSFFEALFLY
jgi:hypothetical protein